MLKENKGFTLIELVVSLLIAGFLTAVFANVLITVYKVNNTSADLSFAQINAQSVIDQISSKIRYANTFNIETSLPGTLSSDTYYLLSDSGFVKTKKAGTPDVIISAGADDSGFTYDVSFKKVNAKVVEINLSVLKSGDNIYETKSDVYINNLISTDITGSSSGDCVSYTLAIPSTPSSGGGTADIKITGLSLSTSTGGTTLKKGGYTLTVIPDISPSDATNKTITWSVSNTAYATIDSNGVLTSGSQKNKTVTVTAQTNDGSGISATINITITN